VVDVHGTGTRTGIQHAGLLPCKGTASDQSRRPPPSVSYPPANSALSRARGGARPHLARIAGFPVDLMSSSGKGGLLPPPQRICSCGMHGSAAPALFPAETKRKPRRFSLTAAPSQLTLTTTRVVRWAACTCLPRLHKKGARRGGARLPRPLSARFSASSCVRATLISLGQSTTRLKGESSLKSSITRDLATSFYISCIHPEAGSK